MAKVQSLTADYADSDHTESTGHCYGAKRHSVRDIDGPQTTNPSIRRMSRMEPRPSVQYSRRMSMASRNSITGSSLANRHMGLLPVKLQNTYKLGPEPNETFRQGEVEGVIKKVLKDYLDGETYNPTQCRNFSQMLTDLIKERVKERGFSPRYKYIVTVTIGQDLNQSVHVVSRCLWNDKTDNYATVSLNKDGLYAVATVYACYLD